MTVAVVLAGGVGSRLGHHEPKQFIEVGGRTILEHSVRAFVQAPEVAHVVVVSTADHVDRVRNLVGDMEKVRDVIVGGKSRTESVENAIVSLADLPDWTKVLIHDGARPLVSQQIVTACVSRLDTFQAVVTVLAVTDTIYESDGTSISGILDRSRILRAQTPQGFRLGLLRAARAATSSRGVTDDVSFVRQFDPDIAVGLVPGDERNLKVTTTTDVVVVSAFVERLDE